MAESSRKLWKIGCFGCLGALVFLLLVSGIFALVALFTVQNEQVEKRAITREVPAATRAAPGLVVLNVSQGECDIMPAGPGEPLRVEAKFDTNAYCLEESLDGDIGTGWIYRLDFRKTGLSITTPLELLFGGCRPRIRVYLPPDVPLRLEVTLSEGGSDVNLGGLWLTSADFDLSRGGFDLRFRKPLRRPMEQLHIRSAMGGFDSYRIGNASPRSLQICHSMGGLDLDLRGQWVRDAEIDIDSHMGGCDVRFPRDVIVEGLNNERIGLKPGPEVTAPVLKVSVSSTMGDLDLRD